MHFSKFFLIGLLNMAVWMDNFNTTDHSLIGKNSKDFIDHGYIHRYIREKKYSLLGSMKYYYLFDDDIYLSDNHLIDSGFFRVLYENDESIELRKEFETLFDNAIENNKICYLYDSRITGYDNAEDLIRQRFNKTIGKENKFIHSAAFSDEKNWQDINDFNDLMKSDNFKKYQAFFVKLIACLQLLIDNKRVRPSPIEKNTFKKHLEYYIDSETKDELGAAQIFFNYINSTDKVDRSTLYDYIDEVRGPNTRQPEVAEPIKELIVNEIYNDLIPNELRERGIEKDIFSAKTNNSTETEKHDKIFIKYKAKTEAEDNKNNNSSSKSKKEIAEEILQKDEEYKLVNEIPIKDLIEIRDKKLLTENRTKHSKKLILRELLDAHPDKGKFDNKSKIFGLLVDILSLPLGSSMLGIIHKVITFFYKEADLYLHYKKDWKSLGDKIDEDLNTRKSASKKNGDK